LNHGAGGNLSVDLEVDAYREILCHGTD